MKSQIYVIPLYLSIDLTGYFYIFNRDFSYQCQKRVFRVINAGNSYTMAKGASDVAKAMAGQEAQGAGENDKYYSRGRPLCLPGF
jgi:hypothetical protein